MNNQEIIITLWFDDQAEEAAQVQFNEVISILVHCEQEEIDYY